MSLNKITINQTVRPINIGFLVDIERINTIKEAIIYNSYLRGGLHNIIIPIWNRQTEKKWKTHYFELIKTCKPDFIVNLTKKNIPIEIQKQYNEEYLLSKETFLRYSEKEPIFLVGIKNYENLNKLLNEIKADNLFGSNKSKFIYPDISFTSKDILLGFLFGIYKNKPFQQIYIEACTPKIIKKITDIQQEDFSFVSPIDTTTRNIKSLGNIGALSTFVAYFGKSDNLYDLIEYRNIRSTGRDVLYVPIEHINVFREIFNRFIKKGYYPINETVNNQISCIKGFSITENQLESAINNMLTTENHGKLSIQNWTPGRGPSGHRRVVKQIYMPKFYEFKEDTNLIVDDNIISSFQPSSPSFINKEEYLPIEHKRKFWAIDIHAHGFFGDKETVTLPFDKSLERIVKYEIFHGFHDNIKFDEGGISVFSDGFNFSHSIRPIEIEKAFKEYFDFYGYNIEDSNAGIIAKKIIEHMGGHVDNCRIFKIKAVRDLLRELSTVLGNNEEQEKRSKEKIKKGLPGNNIIDKLQKEQFDTTNVARLRHFHNYWNEGNEARIIFEHLFNKGILHPGLLFKCENCLKSDWYSVKDFSDHFRCRYCFKDQQVQLMNENGQDNKRNYKPDGLFALPDGGQGSIAVITTLNRLYHFGIGRNFYYITSINLIKKDNPQEKYECDFVGIINNEEGDNCELILGEVKNYSCLTKKDFEKLLKVANSLAKKPMICLSIFRDEYSDDEKKNIKRFIKKGFLVLPFTRQELDPFDLYERFKDLRHPYTHSFIELSENLIRLNIDSEYFVPF